LLKFPSRTRPFHPQWFFPKHFHRHQMLLWFLLLLLPPFLLLLFGFCLVIGFRSFIVPSILTVLDGCVRLEILAAFAVRRADLFARRRQGKAVGTRVRSIWDPLWVPAEGGTSGSTLSLSVNGRAAMRKHSCCVRLMGESEAVSQVDAKGRRINSKGCLKGVNKNKYLKTVYFKRTYTYRRQS